MVRLIRQLQAIRAEDAALTRSVRAALVDMLYAPFRSLVVGAIAGTIIAATVAVWSHEAHFALVAGAIGLVGLARIYSARTFLGISDRSSICPKRWEQVYAHGAFAFAALLGLLAFLTMIRGASLVIEVVTSTTAVGYAAGIAGRNAGRPLLAIGQLALATLPLVAGLLANSGAHAILGFVILLFLYAMIDITLSTREIIVTALVTTDEKAALADRLSAQAKLFDIALSNMSHGLCMFDADNRLLVWNTRFSQIFPHGPAMRVGLDARRLFATSIAGADLAPLMQLFDRAPSTSSRTPPGTAPNVPPSTSPEGRFVVDLSDERALAVVHRRTDAGGLVIIVEDISEQRRNEAQIERMARFDSLTGLHNRNSFTAHVAGELAKLGAQEQRLAILLLDLDRFKAVNDNLGHPAGDLLLQQVADRLRRIVPAGGFVARLGGDEFVVLLDVTRAPANAVQLASLIVETLARPFMLEGSRVMAGASVGIAMAPDDSEEGSRLLKCADIALYAAKAEGRGRYSLFRREMEAAARTRHALEMDLRNALGRGEFALNYQPIVDIRTGAITACEALLRWHHPVRGAVPPGDFIPLAEETGLILSIGRWVLGEACRQARTWPASVSVAVNLSASQFADPSLSLQVAAALDQSGLAAHRLVLEVTETVTLGGNEATLNTMENLRTLGVRLAIDDFGTGYSSLSYLTKYRFDKLKIDQAFVRDLRPGTGALAIVRAMVTMAKNLGMTIVAEGIETPAQRDALAEEGCDLGQGYFFSRPVSKQQIALMLGRSSTDQAARRDRHTG